MKKQSVIKSPLWNKRPYETKRQVATMCASERRTTSSELAFGRKGVHGRTELNDKTDSGARTNRLAHHRRLSSGRVRNAWSGNARAFDFPPSCVGLW
eukprot:1195086-Prorocentrum_minimum.AAC.2